MFHSFGPMVLTLIYMCPKMTMYYDVNTVFAVKEITFGIIDEIVVMGVLLHVFIHILGGYVVT